MKEVTSLLIAFPIYCVFGIAEGVVDGLGYKLSPLGGAFLLTLWFTVHQLRSERQANKSGGETT